LRGKAISNLRFQISKLSLILIGAATLFLVGNERLPLWDRDEPRYAECSREMLKSGDWVVPRFLGDLRAHKPPFIYWCQAASMAVFGETGGAARLPSAVAVMGTDILLSLFVWRFAGPRRAIWTALVFSTSALVVAAAKMANTDAVLLLWIAVGQGCLYVLWRSPSWKVAILFWVSVGMAGLTKGPVVLGMHAATLVVFWFLSREQGFKWWTRLHPVVGMLIVAAIVSPWLILVNQRAPDFLPRLLNRAGRYASSGAEGHAQLPGFYLLLIWALFFPWSVMLPTAIGMGIRHRNRPLLRFALAAAIGPWIVMEIIPNKLPFYILPSFPGLAVLTAEAIVRSSCAKVGQRDDDLKRRPFFYALFVWFAGIVVITYFLFSVIRAGGGGGQNSDALTVATVAGSIAGLYFYFVAHAFQKRQVASGSAMMGIGMAILITMIVGQILPLLPRLNASREMGMELGKLGAGGQTTVAMIDFREPSLAFYQGGGAREIDAGALRKANPPEWAVITKDGWSHLSQAVQTNYQIVGQPHPVLIYNDGKQIKRVLIIHKKPD